MRIGRLREIGLWVEDGKAEGGSGSRIERLREEGHWVEDSKSASDRAVGR